MFAGRTTARMSVPLIGRTRALLAHQLLCATPAARLNDRRCKSNGGVAFGLVANAYWSLAAPKKLVHVGHDVQNMRAQPVALGKTQGIVS